MTAALLIPVKDLGQAKTRLSAVLNAAERHALAEIMLTGTLRVAGAVPGFQRRVVVTSDRSAMALAAAAGFESIEESGQTSESRSVDAASAALEREGATAVLRIPLDLPLLAGGDIARILAAAAHGAQAVLVPSLSGTGTNGLLRAPPTLFPSHFGPGSLSIHERVARARTSTVQVLRLESMALDIDDGDDLRELVRRAAPCAALDYLRGIGIERRLERVAPAHAGGGGSG